jgi:hypothetical protein
VSALTSKSRRSFRPIFSSSCPVQLHSAGSRPSRSPT